MYRYIYITVIYRIQWGNFLFCFIFTFFYHYNHDHFYSERRKLLKSYGWNACFVFCYDL